MSVLALSCDIDDFWLRFVPQWKARQLSPGEAYDFPSSRVPQLFELIVAYVQTRNIGNM